MLSRPSRYAVQALCYLAQHPGRPVPIDRIAEGAGVPAPYLGKILHALTRKGLIVSRRGVHGGVVMAHPAESVTLFDLCEALEDPLLDEAAFEAETGCHGPERCAMHRLWDELRQREIAFLKGTHLGGFSICGPVRHADLPEEAALVEPPVTVSS
jgi:Rrf2 family protein